MNEAWNKFVFPKSWTKIKLSIREHFSWLCLILIDVYYFNSLNNLINLVVVFPFSLLIKAPDDETHPKHLKLL